MPATQLDVHRLAAAQPRHTTCAGSLSAQYNRLRGRRGPAKATVAVGHSILVIAYHLMERDQDYADLGADYFLRRHDPQRQATKLVRQLKALGYGVSIQPVEAA